MQRLASSAGLGNLVNAELPDSLRASPDDIAELLASGRRVARRCDAACTVS
jgi:hypothetical protein